MRFDEVLRTWSAFFEKEGIRYAVVGGLAVHAWGRSRNTRDVDLAVELQYRERVVTHAESLGYETLYVSRAFSNHLKGDDRVDFMYLDPATAAQVFERAERRAVIADLELEVARPEHLIAMKGLAIRSNPRRADDVGDILYLLRLPGVDRSFVRDYFRRQGMLDIFNELEKRI